jgi:hypothetical protein
VSAALLVLAGCKETPTSILLTIRAEPEVPALDELRLTVFSDAGVEVKNSRLPESGAPSLPDDVALFPGESSGDLRVLVRGLAGGSEVAEGTNIVELQRGVQVRAVVVLRGDRYPDDDGDGVPNLIDNCPGWYNPDQGPCQAEDGGVDGAADGATDLARDIDLKPDIDCDVDNDTFLSEACGGMDCDDQDDTVSPGQKEGPVNSGTCSDGKDNDCDGKTDKQDTGCLSCTGNAGCNDQNPCTEDLCKGGKCSNGPTSEGKSCSDGDACTENTVCKSGLCGWGTPVSCPTPTNPCETAECDPAQGCVTKTKADGTSCKDNKYCTVSDVCKAGVCVGQPRDCGSAPVCNKATCDETQKTCVTSPEKDGTTCDDQDSCTQDESCQGGKCVDPGVQVEDVVQHNLTLRSDRALAIDSKGKLHTVYHEQGGRDLRYATNASGSWANQRLGPSAGIVGTWSGIAFDASDTAYVVFADLALGKTVVGHRASGATSWKFDQLADGAGHNSIAVDGSGTVHLSFQNAGDLYYASGTPSNWNTVKVDPGPTTGTDSVGYHSSLAVDSKGKVHIAHGIGATITGSSGLPLDQISKLRYTTNAGGSWSTVEPVQGITGNHGGFASLAVDQGKVHITHTSNTDFTSKAGTIYLTSNVGGTWSTTTFGSGSKQSGSNSSLLLDGKGNIHVAYRDPATEMLMHATDISGSWALTPLASQGSTTNGWAAIAQQKNGQLHVTFENGNARMQHVSFSACP